MRKRMMLYGAVIALVMSVLAGTGVSQAQGPDHTGDIPRKTIDLPDAALARPAGVSADSIAALSPGIPSHAEPGGGGCDKDIDLTTAIRGMTHIAALDTGICDNADIDYYVASDGTEYVVIAGRGEAAWTHIDVSDPANPVIVQQYSWRGNAKATSSPDIKAFKQGTTEFVALSTEIGGNNSTCGLFIFDVSNPADAQQLSRTFESGVWCSVHNAYVETDASGDGTHVYITANSSADLRVYDIADPSAPVKVGTYQRQVRGFFGPGTHDDIYVHDVTVEDGIVYASYWLDGLDMLSSSLLRGGAVINETNGGVSNIDPADFASGNPFLTHHAFPSGDGSLVVLEDEIEIANGAEVVQLWTTAGAHVDNLVEGTDVPVLPAHNVDINHDIDGNRLHVGWYKGGLQSWAFDGTGFTRDGPAPRTASIYHQAQTEAADDPYSGAWGVRTAVIGTDTYNFVSDRSYGLIVGCSTCTATFGTVTGTVTDSSTGNPIQGASVSADTGQNDTTDQNGDYTLSNVPTGNRTITASASGYVMQQKPATVNDGQTTIVDFALDPEPAGNGTIKGTVRDASTGSKLGGVLVTTDTGESATTNNGGKYTIRNVPAGNRTVTASLSFYVTQQQPATVVAGQTTTVDFDLVPM